MPTKRGIFGAAAAFAEGTSAGNMESSSGSARVTPAPRSSVRRERRFLVMSIGSSFHFVHLKWRAGHNPQNDRRKAVIASRRITHNPAHHRHIPVIHAAAQRIRE